MHGRDHRRIIERRGGCGGQHMRSLSLSKTRSCLAHREEATTVSSFIDAVSVDSFCKDGRKISIGDCALFKPPQDSPPFIGIIRCLRPEPNNLHLGINWLYRPVELKLGKGILLDAAPNEIFYSFHEDEIPAASLLHPCKVAFLPRGTELPSGTSSFVCRRVYDIESKCLWWLTDQDYIDERQQEVDRLLRSTRSYMDASFQSGNHSPKLTNNSMSTSQFKQGSDNILGSPSSVPSQTKSKKRERGDHSFDPVKRERSVKSEEADTGPHKPESSLRSEIAKMKERGRLVDHESVEKLVQLMQLEKINKKGSLASCSMLAGVIAATDKFDCLTRFIQLKGLPVLDEWLQDVHKGKVGYVSSLKDGEKSVEEFLLALLRALDKLPVNLHALQSCNIGRSVNHLRSHKNLEIQRKARSLVDTWKKRVEAEMNATDAKTGSPQAAAWSAKSRLSDAHGSKTQGGSGDIAMKSSVTQPSSKPISVKVSQAEPAGNSASSSPGALKSASSPASGKESNPRITAGSADTPLSTRDEKSSSSSQSHNFSQSFSVKDDARSSPVGAMSISKISSRHRKSVNGYPGTVASTNQRETGSNRNSSTHRSSTLEKVSVAMVDKALEVPPVEGNPPKLIVKIPNRGRSPAQSISGGSLEEPVTSSRASSPVPSDKHEGSERNSKEKGDAGKANLLSDAKAESWQSNDFKDLQAGSDDGDGSPTPRVEKRSRTVDDARRGLEVSKAASSSSGKLHDASFSSMNALIESCVKYSEANTSMSPADDGGMNLLASVAAGEICKSDLPPNEASQGYAPPVDEQCTSKDVNLKLASEENQENLKPNFVGSDNLKYGKSMVSLPKDVTSSSKKPAAHASGDRKTPDVSIEYPQAVTGCGTKRKGRMDDNSMTKSLSPPSNIAKDGDGDLVKQPGDQEDVRSTNTRSSAEAMDQKIEVLVHTSSKAVENRDEHGRLNASVLVRQKSAELTEANVLSDTGYVKDMVPGNSDEHIKREADENHIFNFVDHSKQGTVDLKTSRALTLADQNVRITRQKSNRSKASGEENEATEPRLIGSRAEKQASSTHVTRNSDVRGSNKSEAEAEGKVELGSSVTVPYSSNSKNDPEMDSKVGFDLNEGLTSDDGKYGESLHSVNSGFLPAEVVNPLSAAAAAASNCIPVSVTVTAAAKGAFVPPVDLLRSKGELGWKGSAVTSAFRPAEPRKVLQPPMTSLNLSAPDYSSSKPCRQALDIDLNVPDERVLEDMGCPKVQMGSSPVHLRVNNQLKNELIGPVSGRSFGGLDLDLNRVDNTNDMLQCSTSGFLKLDAPSVPLRSSPSGSFPSSEVRRDFDLNGPSVEDASAECPSFTLLGRSGMHSINTQQALPGLRSSNFEAGNFSNWFSPGTSYSSIAIPSSLPDRGEQPFPGIPPGASQRILGAGSSPFTPDVFRGSILTSQAVPFAPSPFTYQMFPFGTTLPLPSTSFSVGSTSVMDSSNGGRLYTPSMNSQFLGPVSAVSSQYPRPYMVNPSENSNNGCVDNSRRWSRQGLDLNTGPGALDIDCREETAQRQLALGSLQSLADDPGRMFPPSGAVLKRREPEGGGWEGENLRYKQPSWQ